MRSENLLSLLVNLAIPVGYLPTTKRQFASLLDQFFPQLVDLPQKLLHQMLRLGTLDVQLGNGQIERFVAKARFELWRIYGHGERTILTILT